MLKIVFGVLFIAGALLGIAVFWVLKPFESDMIATANTSASVDIANYPGYVETVNYWPFLGWIMLLAIIGFGIYVIVKKH